MVATITLPQIRLPQSELHVVPAAPSASGYQIYGYGVPTVSDGSLFSVKLSGYTPGLLQYSLTSVAGNSVVAVLSSGRPSTSNSSFTVVARGGYSLEFSVIAYNGTGYTLEYSGVWSPFDFLAVYFAPAVFLIIASLAAAYYFGTRIPRQLNEEAVEKELEERRHRQGASTMTSQVEGSTVVVHPRLLKN